MHAKNDDEIYDVDGTYLGPPGRYIARLKYKQIILFPALGVPAFIVLRQLGMPMTLLTVALFILLCLKATQLLTSKITRERPFSSLITSLVHDVHAPKAVKRYYVPELSHRRAQRIQDSLATPQLEHRVPRPHRRVRARDLERKTSP